MKNTSHEHKKVGLITPYTGSNLGDAAIQEAVIQNIRKRLSKVDIYLFVQFPEKTEKMHQIKSFPLTAECIAGYSFSLFKKSAVNRNALPMKSTKFQKAKQKLKKYPYLFFVLKYPYKLCKFIFKGVPLVIIEFIYIIKSYYLLKDFDLLIVSGGGQIDDYWGGPMRHPYSLFKWALIAKATNTRFIMLSIGFCSLESRVSRFFIKRSLNLAEYISYRDQKSKDLMSEMGVTQDDKIYPDLAFSYSHNISRLSQRFRRNMKNTVVGISPIAYLSNYGWPKENLSVFQKYIDRLTDFTVELVKRKYYVILFSSDAPDWHINDMVIEKLKRNVDDDLKRYISNPIITTVDELIEQFDDIDFIVASRLHGVLLSHLMNIPTVAISYDKKVNTYMENMEQSQYCIDIHAFELDELMNKFNMLVANSINIKESIKIKAQDYNASLQSQYDQLLRA